MFASTNRNRRSTHTYPHNPTKYGGSSTGGGNLQGPGAGSGRTGGGWIHLSDLRAPPDWGRIADTEDIFGSVEVEILEGGGAKIREGSYQSCIGYRLVTRNGM